MQRATSRRPVRWYTLLGLVIVPVLIAGVLLTGATPTNTDLRKIQGAIVNNDEGIEIDGQKMPLGRMLAAKLYDSERDQNYTWVMADEPHATAGLASGRYAVVVTIPEDFSTDATSYSANDSSARQARIEVATSPAAGISDTAIGEMVTRAAVEAFNQTITEKYLDNIYLALNSTGEQMMSLQDGINKLAEGSAGLAEGLGTMAEKGRTLADGASELSTGTGKLSTGLNTLATNGTQLATGTAGLSDGTSMLADGLGTMAENTTELPAKAENLASGVSQYVDGTHRIINQLEDLAPKLANLPDSSQLTNLSSGLVKGLARHSDAIGQLAKGKDASGDAIPCPSEILDNYGDDGCAAYLVGVKDAGSTAATAFADAGLATSANKLDGAVTKVTDTLGGITSAFDIDPTKLTQLKSAGTQLKDGTNGLTGQLGTLAGGIAKLSGGAAQLNEGATKLAGGVSTYVGGVGTVAGNVEGLAAGTEQFATGIDKYTGGVTQVASGSKKLATGLETLDQKMADKVADLPDYTETDRAALATTVAAPISADNLQDITVPTAARSAILLTLALWLGALVTFVLLRPIRTDTALSTLSTPKLVAHQLAPGIGIGLLQALALSVVAKLLLRLDGGQWGVLTLLLAVTAIAFMLVIQGIASWLHAPGRVLALTAAVVTGLSTLSHTVPNWFADLAATTPLAPANEAIRNVLIGDPVSGPALGLLGWAILGGLLASAAIIKARRKTPKEVFS